MVLIGQPCIVSKSLRRLLNQPLFSADALGLLRNARPETRAVFYERNPFMISIMRQVNPRNSCCRLSQLLKADASCVVDRRIVPI